MRASRPVSLSIAVSIVLGLAACGGDDSSADDERLTRAEYDLLVRQHRETVALLKATPGESAADVQKVIDSARRQCGELRSSGPILKATGPSCDVALEATESLGGFAAAAEKCGEEDAACLDRALGDLVTSLEGVVSAFGGVEKAIEGADLSAACREVLIGPAKEREILGQVATAGRALVDAGKEAEAAPDDSAAQERYAEAGTRFETAAGAVDDLDETGESSNPKPCESDVEA